MSSTPTDAPDQVRDVLERAIAEPDFGRRLIEAPDTALAEYHLSDVQLLLLRSLDKEDLEKLTPDNLEEYFSMQPTLYSDGGGGGGGVHPPPGQQVPIVAP